MANWQILMLRLELSILSPVSEPIKVGLSQLDTVLHDARAALPTVTLPSGHRYMLPALLHDLALEHAWSIGLLISTGRFASAFALTRSEFECLIRGLWLYHRASDDQIATFVKMDKGVPNVGDMIAALENGPGFESKVLSSLWDVGRKAMHGYTHGGIHQLGRRMNGKYVEAVFEDAAILEAIQLTAQTAVTAFSAVADMADRSDLLSQAKVMMDGPASSIVRLAQ